MSRVPTILRCVRSQVRSYSVMSCKDPRSFSTSQVMRQPPSLARLKKLQQDFQCEDGRPVFLKSGFCDRILYTTTVVLCYIGLGLNILTIYDQAKPQSWKTGTVC